jgi:pantoate--beta-alanine ligase
MKVNHTVDTVRSIVKEAKNANKTVGLVPTMGFLHEGHLSLMKRAKEENDLVVVSIFVNPTQFGPNEDLASYPRDLERDMALCASAGVDVIFNPSVEEMYPEGYSTYVNCEGRITATLCGASRSGHFKGVTSVVSKLFNIVSPDRAYFGQKDAQQVAVIEKMVRDLNMDIQIMPCEIVRESDGLALSSRNTYLTKEERQEALVLNQALKLAKNAIEAGERRASVIIEKMKQHVLTAPSAEIDYIQVVSARTLEDLEVLEGDVLIAMAVKIGKPRLIDNMRIFVEK